MLNESQVLKTLSVERVDHDKIISLFLKILIVFYAIISI